MVQVTKVFTFCDQDDREGKVVEGEPYLFEIKRRNASGQWVAALQPMVVDLCGQHLGEAMGSLQMVLNKYGTVAFPKAVAKKPLDYQCPECEFETNSLPKLRNHANKDHDSGLDWHNGIITYFPLKRTKKTKKTPKKTPRLELVSGEQSEPERRYVCDVEGCSSGDDGGPKWSSAPQGLAAHKRWVHNVAGSSKATKERLRHQARLAAR